VVPVSVVAVLNRKGGAGKTSLTKDLSYALVAAGQRVFQVGLDPQSSLEVLAGLGFDTPPEQTVSRLLLPEAFPDAAGEEGVVHVTPWAAELVPASKALASVERALGDPPGVGARVSGCAVA
jgi:chromosome partitioning protein